MSKSTTKIPTYSGFYTPHLRTGDYDGTVTNPITGEVTSPPTRTKQGHIAECDINNIIRDFKVTGQIAHINQQARQGMYADLTDALDFQESLHVVQRAQAAFASLPSAVRNEFANDPARFLAYIGNPANKERLYEWGLATRPAPEPAPASPTAAPAPTSAPATPSA